MKMGDGTIKEDLKNVIYKTREPLLLKSLIKWEVMDWSLDKWNHILSGESLKLRCGLYQKTENPQWERTTPIVTGCFSDLLKHSDPNKWYYFDYKYLHDWCLSAKELRENIKFEDLGLCDVKVEDSTIWIGTKGAHTPCHIDTYGCNVVVQLYGKKLWLLFPPNEDLKSSRIPYEESSVYSSLNFFSPSDFTSFKGISSCKMVTLNPGDVLIVPHKWWHYVENLELSISINTWLPLPQDDCERKSELIVQMIMGSFVRDLNKEEQNIILNPNSEILLDSNIQKEVQLMNQLMKMSSGNLVGESLFNNSEIEKLIDNLQFISRITDSSKEDLEIFLKLQSGRFSNTFISCKEKAEIDVIKVLQELTHPDVVNLIMKKLF